MRGWRSWRCARRMSTARDEREERARVGRGPRRDQGDDRRRDRGGSAHAPAEARRPAGVQADRQLRGRIRCGDALSLFDLRSAACSDEAEDEAEVSDARKVIILGGGPNRIGQGIEFDYCCCHAAFALGRDGGGPRDDHGQLQPGDGLDRPGHVRPALFRAADGRGRAGDRRARDGEGRAARA